MPETRKLEVIQKEQDAWCELMGYVDYTAKHKSRKYRGVKHGNPDKSLTEIEEEFLRRLKKWENAYLTMCKACSAAPPAKSESPPKTSPQLRIA